MRLALSFLAASLLLACADGDDKRPPETPLGAGVGGAGAGDAKPGSSDSFALVDLRLPGGQPIELRVSHGKIAQVGASVARDGAPLVAGQGRYVVPGFVDSHVHLSYYPVGERLPARGILAAVDLGAPLESLSVDSLSVDSAGLELLHAGPLLTAPLGYPTQSWGRDGYGWELQDTARARDAVRKLAELGAGVVKLAITSEPTLTEAQIEAIVQVAHEKHLKVVAHALGAAQAERAARLGVDVLAHTPTEALTAEGVAAWADRAVISTLACFGGGVAAVDNLRRLHEAGARVLYGTDLGNLTTVGLSTDELSLLSAAGLDASEILESLTRAPAEYWGFAGLGAVSPGAWANFVIVAGDPLDDPSVLVEPAQVYRKGRLVEAPH